MLVLHIICESCFRQQRAVLPCFSCCLNCTSCLTRVILLVHCAVHISELVRCVLVLLGLPTSLCNYYKMMHKSLISSTTAVHYWHKPVVWDICLWCRNAVDVLGLLYSLVIFLCEKKMMIGWRNVWSMKLRVQDQEEDQRGPGEVVREDCQACKMNREDAIDRCKWRKMIKDVRWSGWVWVGVSSGTGLPGLSRTKGR